MGLKAQNNVNCSTSTVDEATFQKEYKFIEKEDAIFLKAMGLKTKTNVSNQPISTVESKVTIQEKKPDEITAQEKRLDIEEEDAVFLSAMNLKARNNVNNKQLTISTNDKTAYQVNASKFSAIIKTLNKIRVAKPASNQEKDDTADDKLQGATTTQTSYIKQTLQNAFEASHNDRTNNLTATKINLAAGVVISTNNKLDLSGHTQSDAEERFKECILNGCILNWQTLHVLLEKSDKSEQTIIDLLSSPIGQQISRYAQAPVPMGGPYAWILYFKKP